MILDDVALIGAHVLDAGLATGGRSELPLVLDELEKVFLIVGSGQSVAEVLTLHDSIWNWISKLTCAGDQHQIAFIFVLPVSPDPGWERALLLGLAQEALEGDLPGIGIARASDSLGRLLGVAAGIGVRDLRPLLVRRASNARHRALDGLRSAAVADQPSALVSAARRVLAEFGDSDYLLDVFCSAPSHANGNRLRSLLRSLAGGETAYNGGESPGLQISILLR